MSGGLRIGVIGLGMMGRNHARVLADMEGVELVAVCDGDEGTRSRYSARGYRVAAGVDDLLDAGVDGAVVAVPTAHHETVACRLAEAGVAALIEKPVAGDVAAALRIVDAFGRAGVVAAVGHIERYNAAIGQLKRRIAGGELGEIYQVTTVRQGPFPARISDVGVIKDLGTHDLDLTAWAVASPYADVAARATFRAGRPTEDMVVIVGSLRNGTVTNHVVNWLNPLKERRVVVTGERGSLVADTLSSDLTFFANASVPTEWSALSTFRGVSEGDMVRYAFPKPEPLRVELEAFCQAVRGDVSGIVPLADGVATLRVAEAALAAALAGETVNLDPSS